jgi:hypothetical protein
MRKIDLDWLIELARGESVDPHLTKAQRETAGRACAWLAHVRGSLEAVEADIERVKQDAKSWIETGEWPQG